MIRSVGQTALPDRPGNGASRYRDATAAKAASVRAIAAESM